MAKKRLNIDLEDVGGVTVAILDGAIDASNVADFQKVLDEACDGEQPKVLLDCAKLSYVNSRSFGLFFKYHRGCGKKGGKFAICSLWDKIRNIIKILGLDKFLDIYPDRKTALAHMRKAGDP